MASKGSTREAEMGRTYRMHVKTSNAYKILVENDREKKLFKELTHKQEVNTKVI
jgi:hypothetical protein